MLLLQTNTFFILDFDLVLVDLAMTQVAHPLP